MFVNARSAARFAAERPAAQLIAENGRCRAIVFGFEPGQEIPAHTSSSTVLLLALEGRGRFRVGDQEQAVAAGDVALCPPHVPHALAAAADSRLIALVFIASSS